MEKMKRTPKMGFFDDEKLPLKLDLQFFAEPGGGMESNPGDQGGTNPGQQQQDPGTDTPPPTPPADNTPPANQDRPKENIFTQEDVNNIVARETKKVQEKILKQLGVEDFNTAKEGIEKFREWQESQKTEQERQQEQLNKLKQDYESVVAEKEKLVAQVSAMKAGVRADSVEDVVVLANALVNDEVTIDEAIKQVVTKYPHFLAQQQQQQEEEQQQSGREKPKFSSGQHQKVPESEIDKWLEAFK